MSFVSTLKAITNKVNSIAKEMDKKVETFADEVLSLIEDYDKDFFTRERNEVRVDMKAAIIKKFEIFKPENKPKSINGYILFCQENREDCMRRNIGISPTDLTKALSVEWGALDNEEKKDYNDRAKLVAPKTEEEKKAKKSASKKTSSKTCEHSGCDKVVKNPTQHTDGCVYCATHFKKVVSEEKKAATPKCKHIGKEGKACSSDSLNGDWCSRHMKKSSPTVSPVAKLEDVNSVEKKSPVQKSQGIKFFKNTVPVSYTGNPEYWKCTGIKIEGKKHRLHKASELVLDLDSPILLGRYVDGKFITIEDLDDLTKGWARQCGIKAEEDIELDEELESEEE